MRQKLFSNHQIVLRIALVFGLLMAIVVTGCDSDGNDEGQASPSASISPSPTSGQSPTGIAMISTDTRIDFPKSLSFDLDVESNNDITDIELRYKINKVTSVSLITTIKPDFTPDTRVTTSWIWDTKKASLPPAAEIDYYWVIRDSAGDRLRTDDETLVFDDSRYLWHELTAEKVSLRWHKGDDDFAQELLSAAQNALTRLSRDTGAQLERDVKILIYASASELQSALVYSQDWTGGIAYPDYGIVAIGIPESDLDWGKRTVAHELTHLVIGQVTYSPYNIALPTWLNEGLAMYTEGGLTRSFADTLAHAISTGTVHSVRSLSGSFPANADQARLAYAQSYSLVKFLIDSYGSDQMLALLEIFREGSNPNDALMTIYGFDMDGLDTLWQASR